MASGSYRPLSSTADIEARVCRIAKSLLERENFHEARAVLDTVAETAQSSDTLRLLADCHARLGDPEIGIIHLSRALALSSTADPRLLKRLTQLAQQQQAKVQKIQKQMKRPRFLRDSIGEVMQFAARHGFRPGCIIDVGVATGTPGLYETFPETQFLLIDPVQENEVFMQDICARYPHAKYFLAAAGSHRGRQVLSVDRSYSGSRLVDAVGRHGKGVDREVEVFTLDGLAQDLDLKGPFIIKIDTEGAELEVLNGAATLLRDTEMLILETRTWPIEKAPQLFETLQHLKERGFVAFDVIDRNYHDVAGYLKQFDLVAVRENGFFRSPATYARQAASAPNELFEDIVAAKLRKRQALLDRIGRSPQAAGSAS